MFPQEIVPPKKPCPAGIPPHVREMVGPQAHTVGIIAKQPGSNWMHRKHEAERELQETRQKLVLAGTKGLIESIRRNQFEKRTDKRNLVARIKNKLKDGLQAAEEDLNYRRNMLKEILLQEESEYTREFVARAQSVKDEKIKEIQNRIQEINLKKVAEEQRIVEEKRLQQYRMRCEQLRIITTECQRKELQEIHRQQIEDKLAKQEAERERDVMYCKLMLKDIEAMKEYEERLERERKKRMNDIAQVYKKQMEGKKLLEEEKKRIMLEEAKLIEKLREEIEQEQKEEKEEERRKRIKLHEEMTEELRKAKEALEQNTRAEKEMELTFCKLIQDELYREKARQTDTRKQMRHEMELFTAHLQEIEKEKKEEERKVEEMRQREMNKILQKKDETEIQACKAKEKLKNEVFNTRKEQVEENKRKAQEEYEKKKNEETTDLDMFEKYQREQEKLRKEHEMRKKMYGEELKKQEDALKAQREREIEAEELRVKNELMAEEQYIRKAELSMNTLCDKKHPFLKKLEGATPLL